jgi:hypothetical protein
MASQAYELLNKMDSYLSAEKFGNRDEFTKFCRLVNDFQDAVLKEVKPQGEKEGELEIHGYYGDDTLKLLTTYMERIDEIFPEKIENYYQHIRHLFSLIYNYKISFPASISRDETQKLEAAFFNIYSSMVTVLQSKANLNAVFKLRDITTSIENKISLIPNVDRKQHPVTPALSVLREKFATFEKKGRIWGEDDEGVEKNIDNSDPIAVSKLRNNLLRDTSIILTDSIKNLAKDDPLKVHIRDLVNKSLVPLMIKPDKYVFTDSLKYLGPAVMPIAQLPDAEKKWNSIGSKMHKIHFTDAANILSLQNDINDWKQIYQQNEAHNPGQDAKDGMRNAVISYIQKLPFNKKREFHDDIERLHQAHGSMKTNSYSFGAAIDPKVKESCHNTVGETLQTLDAAWNACANQELLNQINNVLGMIGETYYSQKSKETKEQKEESNESESFYIKVSLHKVEDIKHKFITKATFEANNKTINWESERNKIIHEVKEAFNNADEKIAKQGYWISLAEKALGALIHPIKVIAEVVTDEERSKREIGKRDTRRDLAKGMNQMSKTEEKLTAKPDEWLNHRYH